MTCSDPCDGGEGDAVCAEAGDVEDGTPVALNSARICGAMR